MTQTPAGKSTGGVFQIPVAATQKNTPAASRKAPKPAAPRLKLLVRRLPPGLTQAEFESALGDEWKVGAGKVDWFQYKAGKVSKDPAKPSRPSRAYIHVVASDHIAPLSDKVRQTSFIDARTTSNDPVLLGPPSLEFAPYAKIPGSRVRKDARQGTIDQDPDFFAFLESLTQPITKPAAPEPTADGEEKKEKKDTVTTTPLVQYIKEKKANKAKEAASTKSKHGKFDKDGKPEKVQAKKLLQRPDKEAAQSTATEKSEKKSKTDKATKEAVKAANKQAANVASKQTSKSATQNTAKDSTPSAPASERKRERGNVAAATKILQRDLGLAPSGSRRKGGKANATEDTSKSDQTASPSEPSKKDAAKSKSGSAGGKAKGGQTPQSSEPVSSRGQSDVGTPPASTTPAPVKSSKSGKGKQAPAPAAATATQAFLKHANASQGVTEPLLETTFAPFGKILKVEIDKKKGFGYIDFAEPDGLQKAIAASPVTVAQSQVVVLERKQNPGGEKSRGKGRGESQPPSNNASNKDNNRGGKANGEGGTSGGSSSRGPRGGRGSRNKGGSKGAGGGNQNSSTSAGEKANGAESK
ncbi:hypothetical protein ASPWEDRAFT_108810 [Aspergillus wentii DTO 134E9]|uniref:RRM domain-containing protein n=1 Tax=Aspergillus wentii DTO 134E9 TaxID=1073089 RepID=A0A1L9RS60_ASPWE|nr:uncharacterized protein ASPWEDRAFT_108810 [Aspergillus wentii DTO 134E9]OJJ37771.1 hypothetical protein ASPWEDRAFT_108810 [Aspergillus wentii DTO 134E9]